MVAASIVAAGISAGASLLGSAFGFAGASAQNKANSALAMRQMDFQRDQNQIAMQFSERMSNTSYQRGMADMKAAGLNPILAYRQGGAGSPSGVTSGGASIPAVNELGEINPGEVVSSAIQARAASAQLKQTTSATKNMDVNTAYKAAELQRFKKYGDSVVGRQADSAAKIAGSAKKAVPSGKTVKGAIRNYLDSKKRTARKQGWMKPKYPGYNTSPSH